MRLTEKFIQALKLSKIPAYRLAWAAGIHPNSLSKYVSGYLKPKPKDERLLKVGISLGLSACEVFENEKKAGCRLKKTGSGRSRGKYKETERL